jgi:hypothetical protein
MLLSPKKKVTKSPKATLLFASTIKIITQAVLCKGKEKSSFKSNREKLRKVIEEENMVL